MLETISIILNVVSILCLILLFRHLRKLDNKLWEAQMLVAQKDTGLWMAAKWFDAYAVNHRAKNTTDSNAKADVNESRSYTLRRLAEKTNDTN